MIERPAGEELRVDPSSDPATRAWFRQLMARLGSVRQMGLPDRQDAPELPLAKLYVPLKLGLSPRATERVDPTAAIARNRVVVVLGEPGSGKTTLTAWLALGMAHRWQEAAPKELAWYVPFPVFLRETRLHGLVGWDDLVERLTHLPGGAPPEGFDLPLWCARGQALLLLDGLDEVPIDARIALTAALREGARRYQGLRIVVTSRVLGYEAAPVERAPARRPTRASSERELQLEHALEGLAWTEHDRVEAQLYHVLPFDPPSVRAFVGQWYRLRVSDPVRLREGIASLSTAVETTPALRELASRPSLLALMAMVHRVYASLPAGRVTLFERAIEAYLESIDRAAGLNDPTGLPLAVKRRWLGVVATHMTEQRRTSSGGWREARGQGQEDGASVGQDQVVRWLEPEAGREGGETFLRYVLERSGLLVPQPGEEVAFIHLAVQDYLAAVVLVEDLGRAFLEPEVAAAAWARLLSWLDSAPGVESVAMVLELLGAQPPVLAAVIRRLLGEAREAPLERRYGLAWVLTHTGAAVIGAEVAAFTDEVAVEVVDTWQELPPWAGDFAPLVRRTPERTRLALNKWPEATNWAGLAGFTRLQDLQVNNLTLECPGLFAAPGWLANLERLSLAFAGPPLDLGALKGAARLGRLILSVERTNDLSVLPTLPALHLLGLLFGPGAEEVHLPALDRLADLLLASRWGCPAPFLPPLPALNRLGLVGLESLPDIPPTVTRLDVIDCPAITDLTTLADHPGLREVSWQGAPPTLPEPRVWTFTLVPVDHGIGVST